MNAPLQPIDALHLPASSVTRTIRIGGLAKQELLAQLSDAGVQFNDIAHELFADERFTTSAGVTVWETVECSVGALGFAGGAVMGRIVERAAAGGLMVCPWELAPHFRLQYRDQPEGSRGFPPSRERAPPGAVTVVSAELGAGDDSPRGFYLRCIEGVLWLRGYRAGAEHVWDAEDRLVFCRAAGGGVVAPGRG